MTRQEKERLYAAKAEELQRIWRNPPDQPITGLAELSDERLDELLSETINQIRFEKVWRAITWVMGAAIAVLITVGVFGLLLFGWRQVLALWR
jgi:hypothetical protein